MDAEVVAYIENFDGCRSSLFFEVGDLQLETIYTIRMMWRGKRDVYLYYHSRRMLLKRALAFVTAFVYNDRRTMMNDDALIL